MRVANQQAAAGRQTHSQGSEKSLCVIKPKSISLNTAYHGLLTSPNLGFENNFYCFRQGNYLDTNAITATCKQDGNGYVSTSELKFVMTKLDVFFTEAVSDRKQTTSNVTEQSSVAGVAKLWCAGAAGDDIGGGH